MRCEHGFAVPRLCSYCYPPAGGKVLKCEECGLEERGRPERRWYVTDTTTLCPTHDPRKRINPPFTGADYDVPLLVQALEEWDRVFGGSYRRADRDSIMMAGVVMGLLRKEVVGLAGYRMPHKTRFQDVLRCDGCGMESVLYGPVGHGEAHHECPQGSAGTFWFATRDTRAE